MNLVHLQGQFGDGAQSSPKFICVQGYRDPRINLRRAHERIGADDQIADAALHKALWGGGAFGTRAPKEIPVECVQCDVLVVGCRLALLQTLDEPRREARETGGLLLSGAQVGTIPGELQSIGGSE